MKNHLQFRKGDITLLVTMLVCLIIIILLLPISDKIAVEVNISKENLMSQQAIQAAKTGLDAWDYYYAQNPNPPIRTPQDVSYIVGDGNWPNRNNTIYPTDILGEWIVLADDSVTGGATTEYKVEFFPGTLLPNGNPDPDSPDRRISTGKVTRNGIVVERTLEKVSTIIEIAP